MSFLETEQKTSPYLPNLFSWFSAWSPQAAAKEKGFCENPRFLDKVVPLILVPLLTLVLHGALRFFVKYFPTSPSFWPAVPRPPSAPVTLALVSAALLWPSLWLVPPHADMGKKQTVRLLPPWLSVRGKEASFNMSRSPVSEAAPLPL